VAKITDETRKQHTFLIFFVSFFSPYVPKKQYKNGKYHAAAG